MILSHGCEIDLADTLSLILLIRDDDLLRYERAAVRWLSRYTAEDRQLRLAEAGELVDMLDAVGKHDQVAALMLERFLRARYEAEDRLRAGVPIASVARELGHESTEHTFRVYGGWSSEVGAHPPTARNVG
jgi:hypothetical protein